MKLQSFQNSFSFFCIVTFLINKISSLTNYVSNIVVKNGVSGVSVIGVPQGVTIDQEEKYLYLTSTFVLKIQISNWNVTKIAQKYNFYDDITLAQPDSFGNVYVLDNSRINIISHNDFTNASLIAGPINGAVGTVDGIGLRASFHNPRMIVFSLNSTLGYITDNGNDKIRLLNMTTKSNQVTSIVINLNNCWGLALIANDTSLYVGTNGGIYKIFLSNYTKSLFLESIGLTSFPIDGSLSVARSYGVYPLVVDKHDNIYFSDFNNTVRFVSKNYVYTLAGPSMNHLC